MEAGKNLFCPSPTLISRNQHRLSVATLRELPASVINSKPAAFVAQHFPTSVLTQEQKDEYKPLLQSYKEDRISQVTADREPFDKRVSITEENIPRSSDQLIDEFGHQLLKWPGLWNLLASLPTRVDDKSSTSDHLTFNSEKLMDDDLCKAVSLAQKALSVSKQAVSKTEDSESIKDGYDNLLPQGMASTSLDNTSVDGNISVRSTRLLERQSKKRKVPNLKPQLDEIYPVRKANAQKNLDVERRMRKGFDQNDPLRLFLWGPETRQLLTLEEESQLIVYLQDWVKLKEVKHKLQSQFGREPTLVEWAKGVGLSCQVMQSKLRSGSYSREKLINANLRMVVHVAKQYQGRGLSFQDLLQEGSMGLMKSVEKFEPHAGCRFASYAYWWIRQAIRKAIFQHSRTIRLPENVYTLLGKVMEAKKLFIQEGNCYPTREDIARRVGITVDKLEKLLFNARIPISMQQNVWTDQDTTFQEITADTAIEIPDVSVAKQLMRQHVRNLLGILSPRDRRIIRLRFGIEDGKEKSLSEIGNVFGLSKERVRQLESRALYKLRQCLHSQGLDAYEDLLV